MQHDQIKEIISNLNAVPQPYQKAKKTVELAAKYKRDPSEFPTPEAHEIFKKMCRYFGKTPKMKWRVNMISIILQQNNS